MSQIIIINSGSGNLLSLKRAIEIYDKKVKVSENYDEILNAKRVFLPGVGAFKNCMKSLREKKLVDTILKLKENKIPLMGICLGMQILFEESHEFGFTKGLGFIKGKIKKIPNKDKSKLFKVPSIGWYKLRKHNLKNSLSEILNDQDEYYFIHSYYATEVPEKYVIASYNFSEMEIPAVVKNENIVGCQFHPEKSAKQGLKIINQFLKGIE